MTRKFTEREYEILYERKPLQNHGDGCGVGIFLFFFFAFCVWSFDIYIFLYFQNPLEESTGSDILMGAWVVLLLIVTSLQCLAIVMFLYFVRNFIVKSKYGKFALIKTFTTSKILILQGESPADFKVQIFNKENEMLEIKTKIRIIAEQYFKENVLLELSKYKDFNSETTDLSIFELIKLSKSQKLTFSLAMKDFSTSAQFDFNESVYSFNYIFRSEYELVYSQKTKEFLFIDYKKGNPFDFQSDIIIKNVEDKIEYVSYDA